MKKLLKGLMAIGTVFVFALALTGCGKEETPNKGGNEPQNNNNPNNPEETISLYSDDNKIVFNYMDSYYITYYHEGETITGLEYIYQYDDVETAKIAKSMMESNYAEEENIKSVVAKGRYIVITFKEEAYKDQSLEEVKQTYSFLEQIYNNN